MYAKLLYERGEFVKLETGETVNILCGEKIVTPDGEVTDDNLQGFIICNNEAHAMELLRVVRKENYTPELRLVQVYYNAEEGQTFAVNDNRGVLTLKQESKIIDTNFISLIAEFKALCSELKSEWKTIRWYEPNMLDIDNVSFEILNLDRNQQYLIYKIGEMCKGFI